MNPGVTLALKLLGLVLAGFLVVVGLNKLWHWPYDRGVADERARIEAEQRRLDNAARRDEQASTVASEATADTFRQDGAAAAAQVATDTKSSIERIEYVYVTTPAAASSCSADGRPAPIPAGVLSELDEAVKAIGRPAPASG
jgi:hypothetical protein